MLTEQSNYRATVVISVYNDPGALGCIVAALRQQTEKRFQAVLSEDGQCVSMRRAADEMRRDFPDLVHLTQEDRGFRKTRALNRALLAAAAERLLFLDGDCVPHRRWVEDHLRHAAPGKVCVGRRVNLGPRSSHWLRRRPQRIRLFQNRLCYLLSAPLLRLDGTRNYEVGLASPLLQTLHGEKRRFILGCNFSCAKGDLLAINGFNEDFVHPGAGEDTDLEWRLESRGVRLSSLRFLAPVFHLHHGANWTTSPENERIMQAAKERHEAYCRNGIEKVLLSLREREQSAGRR
jgi:glycosyltransferase involved in cell wall biosynthesis